MTNVAEKMKPPSLAFGAESLARSRARSGGRFHVSSPAGRRTPLPRRAGQRSRGDVPAARVRGTADRGAQRELRGRRGDASPRGPRFRDGRPEGAQSRTSGARLAPVVPRPVPTGGKRSPFRFSSFCFRVASRHSSMPLSGASSHGARGRAGGCSAVRESGPAVWAARSAGPTSLHSGPSRARARGTQGCRRCSLWTRAAATAMRSWGASLHRRVPLAGRAGPGRRRIP